MKRFTPSVSVSIPEPCSAAWETMRGDSRTRHCETCDHDVLNTASMTPGQIEAVLANEGPLPCMRIAQRQDGSWLTATERRGERSLGAMAGAAISALISVSALQAAAQQHTVGRMTRSVGVVSGQVLGVDGKPAAKATIYLNSSVHGKAVTITGISDEKGYFFVNAAPGEYELSAGSTTAPLTSNLEHVVVGHGNTVAPSPLKLEPIMVTAGVPLMVPPPLRESVAPKRPPSR